MSDILEYRVVTTAGETPAIVLLDGSETVTVGHVEPKGLAEVLVAILNNQELILTQIDILSEEILEVQDTLRA